MRFKNFGQKLKSRFACLYAQSQAFVPVSPTLLCHIDRKLQAQYERTGLTYAQILCVYKRSYLSDQLKLVLNQSILPTTLYIYQNNSHVCALPPFGIAGLQNICFTHNRTWNAYYHGRFYAALMSREPNVIIWDDDIQPGKKWNEYTLSKSKQYGDAIVTANGRILSVDNSQQTSCINETVADEPFYRGQAVSDTIVDYGGHSWTFPRYLLNTMASIDPPSLQNSEDFHISAAAYLKNKILTVMPAQEPHNHAFCPEYYLSGSRAWDRHASYLSKDNSDWKKTRSSIIRTWITQHGYIPLESRSG